jgi:multicomponent Na+:H+ antiporter subunit A
MLSLGSAAGMVGAAFYVIAHALAKSALFLTAGAVTVATGENRLDRVGGLARSMPGFAAASAVAAAALVSLPLTAGFFADELLFAAARERGPLAAGAVVAGAMLTFAYMSRFWLGIFLGRPVGRASRPTRGLVLPVGVLAGILLVTGVVPRPIAHLAVDAADSSLAGPGIELAYHVERWETVFALAVYVVGATLLLLRRFWWVAALAAARLGERIGPDTLYGSGLARLNALSDRMHGMEVRDLRTRIAAVLVPAGALVLLGVLETPTAGAYRVGGIDADDLGLALALGAAALAAVAVTLPRHHITLVLVLSAVGFALAVAYAFFGAPNVALVAVLVETMLAGLFVGILALLPRRVLRRESRLRASGSRRWRDPLVGVISGLTVFTVAWGALSRPRPADPVTTHLVGQSEAAHAENVVTAILVDFRGLDTLGEITVLGVALVGLAVLLRRGRPGS